MTTETGLLLTLGALIVAGVAGAVVELVASQEVKRLRQDARALARMLRMQGSLHPLVAHTIRSLESVAEGGDFLLELPRWRHRADPLPNAAARERPHDPDCAMSHGYDLGNSCTCRPAEQRISDDAAAKRTAREHPRTWSPAPSSSSSPAKR